MLNRSKKAAFAFIFVTVVLDMLALGIMVPILPKLLTQFRGGDHAAAAALSGWFGLTWAAMQFLASPLIGMLSDRFGRRPVILLSNFCLGLDYFLMALAPNVSWLFVGRIISGITAATFSTAAAYIADVTPAEERAGKFGLLGAAFGLGFIIGPAIGGLLGSIDLRLPFWVAGILSVANAAYGYLVVPESLPFEKRSKFDWAKANPMGSLKLLTASGSLWVLSLASALYYLAHESLPSVFVLYTDYRYQWSESTVGLVLAGIGVCSMLVSAVLVQPTVKKLGEKLSLIVGLAFGALGFAIYGLAPTGAIFMVGIPVVALWGLIGPAMQTLMTQAVGASEQGQLQGALSCVRGIMGMLGPPLFTQVFGFAIGTALVGAPYLLASGFLLLALLLSLTIKGNSSTVAQTQSV